MLIYKSTSLQTAKHTHIRIQYNDVKHTAIQNTNEHIYTYTNMQLQKYTTIQI